EAWMMRGNARLAQEAFFDANLHYEKVLSLDPGLHEVWNNRGSALMFLMRYKEAEQCLRRSFELKPAGDPCANLGNLYASKNMVAEAEAEFRKALEFWPGNPDIAVSLAIILFAQKKWKEGGYYYTARHANVPYQSRSRRDHKNWDGEPIEGKTLLVYGEQG